MPRRDLLKERDAFVDRYMIKNAESGILVTREDAENAFVDFELNPFEKLIFDLIERLDRIEKLGNAP
jgi:hypothetical protein